MTKTVTLNAYGMLNTIIIQHFITNEVVLLKTFKALNGLKLCADVPLRNFTHSLTNEVIYIDYFNIIAN